MISVVAPVLTPSTHAGIEDVADVYAGFKLRADAAVNLKWQQGGNEARLGGLRGECVKLQGELEGLRVNRARISSHGLLELQTQIEQQESRAMSFKLKYEMSMDR